MNDFSTNLHIELRISSDIYEKSEVWSNGYKTGDTAVDLAQALYGIKDTYRNVPPIFSNPKSSFSGIWKLKTPLAEKVKAASISPKVRNQACDSSQLPKLVKEPYQIVSILISYMF
jgi:hypothetical protein